jgi:hypothetical protein
LGRIYFEGWILIDLRLTDKMATAIGSSDRRTVVTLDESSFWAWVGTPRTRRGEVPPDGAFSAAEAPKILAMAYVAEAV